jgi:hypothetical protein
VCASAQLGAVLIVLIIVQLDFCRFLLALFEQLVDLGRDVLVPTLDVFLEQIVGDEQRGSGPEGEADFQVALSQAEVELENKYIFGLELD